MFNLLSIRGSSSLLTGAIIYILCSEYLFYYMFFIDIGSILGATTVKHCTRSSRVT